VADHTIIFGNVEDVLASLDAESVDVCVTSPPFYNLRDYGKWQMVRRWDPEGRGDPAVLASAFPSRGGKWQKRTARRRELELRVRAWLRGGLECPRTGVRMDALGLEPTPELYVRHLVLIFREVRRVLRPTGTVWLNLGDAFAGSGKAGNNPDYWKRHTEFGKPSRHTERFGRGGIVPEGLKPKDLMGIPWMVAFALRADGWYLRQRIVWAKGISGEACRPCPQCGHKAWHGSTMPESPKDRPTTSCEEVFLLSKEPHYWYDYWAVREEGAEPAGTKGGKGSTRRLAEEGVNARPPEYAEYDGKRNWRSVWTISPKGTEYAHFAVFPPTLAENCIRAGCPPLVCAECGAPWEHRVEVVGVHDHPQREGRKAPAVQFAGTGYEGSDTLAKVKEVRDLGYHATCDCGPQAIPGLVLEPFCGSGTTTAVARKLGRRSIGIELNPEYEGVIRQRLGQTQTLFQDLEFIHTED